MTSAQGTASGKAWEMIEQEKRRDRRIRRVCVAAWVATFGIAVIFAMIVGAQVIELVRAARVGAVPWTSVVGAAMPFMGVLWTLSLLVAALSTVGVFLRLRTASLAEVQLRLAALEEILGSPPDSAGAR